ncbi:hypothetical protein diail_6296 [Diaporthe ilicicola]|nr:hypothetical protein diail_6296 [Diaporthe ilicicola]
MTSKKHAREESPHKLPPSKKPKTEKNKEKYEINDDPMDVKLFRLKGRVIQEEKARRNDVACLSGKMKEDKNFLVSKMDEKLAVDAAMDAEEHEEHEEELITNASKMATPGYLRKVVHRKIKDIANDMLDDRDAAIMKLLEAKVNNLVLENKLATMQAKLDEQDRKNAELDQNVNRKINDQDRKIHEQDRKLSEPDCELHE